MPILLLILGHTPRWVWAILAFILLMGWLQSREQLMSRPRLLLLPLAWLGFGAWGIEASFGLHLLPLLAWAFGLVLALFFVKRTGWPGAASFDEDSQRFHVPGSWLPLALMLGLFLAKYALGVSLALLPALAQQPVFAALCSAVFGLLGGALLGRSRNILGRVPASLSTAQA